MSRRGMELARPAIYGLSLFSWWGGNQNNEPADDNKPRPDGLKNHLQPVMERKYRSESNERPWHTMEAPPKYTTGEEEGRIARCRTKIEQLMIEKGIPGMVIGVSDRGHRVWSEAFGYCDVENLYRCRTEAVMRIASISKSVTMATVVAKLIEDKILDLDKTVHDYIDEKDFPKQKFKGNVYEITLRQLLSNTSGIRHYHDDEKTTERLHISSPKSPEAYMSKAELERSGPFERRRYNDVFDSLALFKNDDLVCEPGSKFIYTTLGWILISAIVQSVLKDGEKFEDYLMKILNSKLGMRNTVLDQEEPIVFNRARYYRRNGVAGRLMNAPFVDCSSKWAGGGLLSTTDDLLKLANVLIHSYKGRPNALLSSAAVKSMWTPIVSMGGRESYGLGFILYSDRDNKSNQADFDSCPDTAPFNYYVFHAGVAMGASSMLMILPEEELSVAIIVNLYEISLRDLALDILKEFKKQS